MDKIRCVLSILLIFNGYWCHAFKVYQRGKPFYFSDEDGRIMEVRRQGYPMAKRSHGGCDCYCLVAGDEATIHCCVQCHVTQSVCFPGSAHVTLGTGDIIKMADLKTGDHISTASETGDIETTEVLGFLTYDPEVLGRYRKLTLENGRSILLSRSHLVFASTANESQTETMFAADVEIGHHLLVQKGNVMVPEIVVSVTAENHKGAYVPLTSQGSLLVDDIKASSYAAYSHHLSHLFLSPLRWFPSLLSLTPSDGDHPYITFLKALGTLIVPGKSRFQARLTNETFGMHMDTLDAQITRDSSSCVQS